MSPNAGYNENELFQMQQDAIRRVQEMQDRARRTMENSWNPSEAPPPEPEALPALPPGAGGQQGGQQGGAGAHPPAGPLAGLGNLNLGNLANLNLGNLSSLFQGQTSSPLSGLMQWAGGERGILVAMLVFLMGEGADPALLLALFYLVMFDETPNT